VAWRTAAVAGPAGGVHRARLLDMTHTRRDLDVAGLRIAVAGVDDPHLSRDPLRKPSQEHRARPRT